MREFLRRRLSRPDGKDDVGALVSALGDYVAILTLEAVRQREPDDAPSGAGHARVDRTSNAAQGRHASTPAAQRYVTNLIFQACVDSGIAEAEEIAEIAQSALTRALGTDAETLKRLVFAGMVWRGEAMAARGERDVAEAPPPLRDEQRAVYEASKAAGQRFAVTFGRTGAVGPSEAEVAFFAERCLVGK